MSAIATAPAAPQPPRHAPQPPRPTPQSPPHARERRRSDAVSPTDYVALDADAQHRGGAALFTVPFASAMTDEDLRVLAQALDLSTHLYPKMRPDPTSPGVARLDHFSGLFLERGATEGQWLLRARTWGRPAPQTVHEWHLLAALAARRLDRDAPLPARLTAGGVT
jgi:hypothetical protein